MRAPIFSFVLAIGCLILSACPDDSKDESSAGDGGMSTAGTTADAADGGGESGTGAAGTGESGTGGGGGDVPAAGVATVKVAKAIEPLKATTYTLDTSGKFAGQRNDDEFFANFDGKADFGSMYGGDTVSLRFGGLNRKGTFKCGDKAKPDDDYAVPTSLELWTFVNAKSALTQYRSNVEGSTCSITVTKLDATSIEGTYTAKLNADATRSVSISGGFHAVP